MKKSSKIISTVTAAAVASSALAWSAFADEPAVHETQPGALLGAATHFHLFANEVSLHSHVHGNVATNMLDASGDFGVRPHNLDGLSSINYIRDFKSEPLNEQTLSTKLVIGSDIEVTDYDNGNGYEINTPSGGHAALRKNVIGQLVIEDEDTPYIDIQKELDGFAEMSETLAEQSNSSGIEFKLDMNHSYIDCSDSEGGFLYYTIDLTDDNDYNSFAGTSQLHIYGVNFDEGDLLYLTIDVGDREAVSFNKAWYVYDENNESYKTGEIPLSQGGGRIIYNFVSNGEAYDGDISLQEAKLGSMLAPRADIQVSNNTCGTIIANTITCNGESHRWDVQVEGTYDNDDRNPLFDPEEEDPVVTTTTPSVTTTLAPETTTSEVVTTTEATTTSKATTTSVATTTEATTTSKATTTSVATTTEATTTSKATTTSVATTTEATTTSKVTTTSVATTTTAVVGGDDEEVTTTTAVVGGDDEEVTTTTAVVGGDDEEVTTTTAVVGGDDEEVTTTTAVVGGDDEDVTTTTAVVGGDDEDVTTTTAVVGGDDEEVTTTTAVVGGDDEDVTTTTAVVGGDDEDVTTTTAVVGGDDEEVTTTTAVVGGDDEEVTTTTATENSSVGGNDENVGGSDDEADLPTVDEVKDMIEKLPEEIKSDEDADEIDKMIGTLNEMIEKGELSDEEIEELEELRKVLGDKYEAYVSSVDENANTGFKTGTTVAVAAAAILVLAAVAGRKKLEEE